MNCYYGDNVRFLPVIQCYHSPKPNNTCVINLSELFFNKKTNKKNT